MILFSRVVLLAAVFALATAVAGWWTVPLVAAVYAASVARDGGVRRGSAVVAGFAAMLGWAALLSIAAARGPVGTLAAELGGILRLPTAGVLAMTIAYPGLLAVSAAVVARALTARRP